MSDEKKAAGDDRMKRLYRRLAADLALMAPELTHGFAGEGEACGECGWGRGGRE